MIPGNPFDKASRRLAKMDEVTFLAWATGLPDTVFAFDGWLDTRAVPLPNEPDQIGDTVARVRNTAAQEPPWVVAIEFQIEPDWHWCSRAPPDERTSGRKLWRAGT